jgi:hypothetical protein
MSWQLQLALIFASAADCSNEQANGVTGFESVTFRIMSTKNYAK